MNKSTVHPFAIASGSAATYGAIFFAITKLSRSKASPYDARSINKAISASHAALTTVLAAYSLRSVHWQANHTNSSDDALKKTPYLDDSNNMIISGRSKLANGITAWEFGYLIYDTGAMVFNSTASDRRVLQDLFFYHHVLLLAGLGTLQKYIIDGRERGVWVIVAFLLMNASNPLLHARWFAKKERKDTMPIDLALAVVFVITRLGNVAWVLQKYGSYHELGGWEAFKSLRWQCKIGTSTLTGFNAIWWILLVRSIARRGLKRSK